MCDISFPFDRDQYFILMIKRIHIAGKNGHASTFSPKSGIYSSLRLIRHITHRDLWQNEEISDGFVNLCSSCIDTFLNSKNY